jgi:Family of unknown function (DUF6328)
MSQPSISDTSEAAGVAPGQGLASEVLDGRRETELERLDRNLNELLSELRVALPGVQVLFAFLLVAPFNQRFGTVTHFERDLYFGTLICTLLASMLLIAPTLVHRLQFRHRKKASIVELANRFMIIGLTAFAVAMTGAVLLITHYLFGAPTAAVTTALVAIAFLIVWVVLPLRNGGASPPRP